jgi:hypothetical protein
MPKTRTTKAKPRKRKPVPSWFMKQWGFVRCSGGLYRYV